MAARRRAGAPVVLLAGLLLAGCGGSDDAGPPSDLPTTAPALWNPCDALRVADIDRLFAARLSVDRGTATAPVCRFTPPTEGDPAIDANYDLVLGTLDELIATFGTAKHDRVRTLSVPRSDGARLIIHVGPQAIALSGFVQNGGLVQTVNVVQPKPYRRKVLESGMRALLGDLASHADSSGLTGAGTRTRSPGPTTGPSATPTG